MRLPTALAVCLLLVGVVAVPAHASDYEAAISITFPVDGPSSYIDDYHSGRSGGRAHRATDIMTDYGTPVHAAEGGEITWMPGLDDRPPSYGYMIRIRDEAGRTHDYVHLGRQDGPASEAYAPGLRQGSRVERGQHIGYAGHSGNAHPSAPHLHYSIQDPAVSDPYGTDYRNPYNSLRDAQARGDVPRPSAEPTPLAGDWNGDGRATPGWFDEGVFRLCLDDGDACRAHTFRYGRAGDVPVVGDWNGDGADTVGIVRDRTWHLRNELAGGRADHSFVYGRVTAGDAPVIGDWNGDGADTVGIVRDGMWHLRDELAGGSADRSFRYGRSQGDRPVVGDWSGHGTTGVGVVRGELWHLRDQPSGGGADRSIDWS